MRRSTIAGLASALVIASGCGGEETSSVDETTSSIESTETDSVEETVMTGAPLSVVNSYFR